MVGDNNALAIGFRVVNLRALDDNRMRGQVDTPRPSRSANKNLNRTVGEKILHGTSIL